MQKLEKLIEQLPPEIQREVLDFVEFLIKKHVRKKRGKPEFKWAGALKDLRDHYTSVELQHKIIKAVNCEQ